MMQGSAMMQSGMMGGPPPMQQQQQQHPQQEGPRRSRPEDAASYITVSLFSPVNRAACLLLSDLTLNLQCIL